MAEKRTIFSDNAQPREETTEDEFEGRKISELPPAVLDADGMVTPALEAGELAIAADVDSDPAEGKETFKITLGDIIDNAKSEFAEYNVKNILAGTHIDDVAETPVDSGNWTINAEKQRMDPGTFVESLNGVKGDVVLTSTDASITIVPEEVLNEDTDELELTGNIDLTLNTTTSSLYRAWIEIVAGNVGDSAFDFSDDTITKDNSVVSINGVVLDGGEYNLAAGVVTILGLADIPLKVGDIIGVISFVAETPNSLFSNPTYGMRTSDISIVGEDPAGEQQPKAVVQNNLQTQQDVNWYLLRTIEDLEIPDAIDTDSLVTEDELSETLEDYATEEWVLAQSYVTEQVVVDAVQVAVDDQKEVDEEQDREIEQIEARVSQIESVSLDAKYLYEGDSKAPRDGEFTCLKNNATETTADWAETQMLCFAENAVEGIPDWEHVTENDVIRIGGSSAGIILPTDVAPADIQHREADTFAEFKVVGIPGERLFEVELIRSSSQPMAGVEYGVLLLSSFDPSGLATTDFVTSELAKKFDKSGGTITGSVSVEGGNLQVMNKEFRVKNGADENAFRIQPESQVTSNVPIRTCAGIRLTGGAGNQFIQAESGVTGKLLYDKADQTEEEKQRFTWGANFNYSWVPVDMKENTIINLADPDPSKIQSAVTINYLNEALGSIDVGAGDAALDANQTWTGTNKFEGLTHFDSSMISKAGTFLELKGDADSVQNRYMKLRGNADFRIYAYPGDSNNTSKNCFSILMKPDDTYPTVTMNYLVDPTSAGNPVNLRYANETYLKKEDNVLTPVVFKCDQYAKGCVKNAPDSGEVSGMYNTSGGSATSANNYWGNVNLELRVHIDKLLDKDGNTIASGYRQSVAGYVSLIGKDNKLYLKAAIKTVSRPSGQDYVEVIFANRTKPFGTGETNSSDGYIIIIEGYEQ